jgi:hypothetical protein
MLINGNMFAYSFGSIICLCAIVFAVSSAMQRRSWISENGIFVGNYQINKDYILPKATTYIPWSEVKQITAYRKEVSAGTFSRLQDYFKIRTKGNKTHNAVLFDREGFLTTIQHFKKSNLLK